MSNISISEKFSMFTEEWAPKIIAESNGQLVKLAKGSGELVWRSHDNEDGLFMVPKGVEHCPLAEADTHLMMIEPVGTAHTGKKETNVTVSTEKQEWI